MKFAKVVFITAGIWGILDVLPLYFLFDFLGRNSPPAINHPEFYYGFAGVTLAWQFVFLLIGSDPYRYRVMMLPSILEKASYVLAVAVLFVQHRLSLSMALPATTDLALGVLFIAAYMRTKSKGERPLGDSGHYTKRHKSYV
ncbi:MAG: hypothetical protein ABSC65_22805 [Acidobacteriaceae bacterium]